MQVFYFYVSIYHILQQHCNLWFIIRSAIPADQIPPLDALCITVVIYLQIAPLVSNDVIPGQFKNHLYNK